MSESRSVVVRLSMEASQFIAEAQKAGKVGEDAMANVEGAAMSTDEAISSVGATAGAVAAGGLATLFATGKAASEWESQWTSVMKTVDETSITTYADLEDDLRGLAKVMPTTHADIAAVASAAGALGVATDDVVDFTETMIMLGEATDDLSADDAATMIAQITNVMGTAAADVDNFAATLVELGNNGASSEGEILSMAQRLAGAGKMIGATEGEVLAMANAMASLGIESELGGGAMSRTMLNMYKAAKDGGEKWAAWAKVAGTSSKDFAKTFENEPVRAVDEFIKGLERIDKSGGNVMGALKELGIKGTQDLQVLLRLKGGGDLLSESLDMQAGAWAQNTALIDEYGKRSATTESQVTIAWNNIRDSGIDAGNVLLPMVASLASGVATLASGFGELGEPVQRGIMYAVMGITGAGGLVWALAKGSAALQSASATMVALGFASEATSRKMMMAKMGMLGAGGMVAGLSLMADESTETGRAIEGLGLTAGGMLMGFAVGGPMGAAVGGTIGLIAGLGKQMLGTKEAAKESKLPVERLAGSYDLLGRSASEANRQLALTSLTQYTKDHETFSESLEAVGLGTRDIIDASLGDAKAMKDVQATLWELLTSEEQLIKNSSGDYITKSRAINDVSDALRVMGLDLDFVRDSTIEAKLATGDWKKEFPGIPKKVLTKFDTKGIPENKAELDKLLGKMKLSEKERKAIFKLLGIPRAKKEADDVKEKLDSIPKSTHTTAHVDTSTAEGRIAHLRSALAAIMSGSFAIGTQPKTSRGATRNADGGTVPTTGMGYADRHPYLLADGEEVISNRYGQADRNRALLKAINGNRLADGGTVGLAMGGTAGVASSRGRSTNIFAELRAFKSGLTNAALALENFADRRVSIAEAKFEAAQKREDAANDKVANAKSDLTSARGDRASSLDILQGRARVRQLQRDLNAKGDDKISGLKREIARKELAAARRDLKDMRASDDVARAAKRRLTRARAERNKLEEAAARQELELLKAQQAAEANQRKIEAQQRNAEVGNLATSQFGPDLFAAPSNVWAEGAGTGPLHALEESIAGLAERAELQALLALEGLTGAAFEQAMAGSNADLRAMIDNGEVGQFASLWEQYEAAQASTSAQAGQFYGADSAAASRELARTVVELQGVQRSLVVANGVQSTIASQMAATATATRDTHTAVQLLADRIPKAASAGASAVIQYRAGH